MVVARRLTCKDAVVEGNDELHLRRTGSFVFFGSVLGPMLHPWFGFLGNIAARVGGGMKGTVAAVAVDQAVMPPALITLFWLTQPVLEGKSFDTALELMNENWLVMLKGNYVVWPAAPAINFTFVPPQFRVLFVNMVSLGWNSFVSWLSHRAPHDDAAIGDGVLPNVASVAIEGNPEVMAEAIDPLASETAAGGEDDDAA